MKTPTQRVSRKTIYTALTAASFILSAAVPSFAGSDTWIGGDPSGATNWNDAVNWQAGTAPLAGDSLIFQGGNVNNSNDFPNGTAFDGITFTGGGSYNLTGNSVLLSGNGVGYFTGVYNNSGGPQAVGLNLSLDWGYYAFADGGGGLALNGGLNPGSNGVAYFYGTLNTGSLTTDSTGLISGLGGQGLMFNGNWGNGASPFAISAPAGLATINAGAIAAYSSFTQVPSGAISSGANNNIELTASGAATAYTDSSATVNTITVDQGGNSGGTATDTLTTTGTLTLGQKGGIYALSTGTANANLLTVTGGSLTAGTTAGASIVFGTHASAAGNSPPNVMTVSSKIIDNPGGGVTVIKVGNSSMVLNSTNTYSGGTYLLQGQIQMGNNTSAVGSGPIYVAEGATLLNNIGAGTMVNNFFLSPGNGSSLWNGTALNPGAFVYSFADGNFFYNGVFTLLGAPVASGTYPPTAGCRIIGNKDAGALCIFQNQITGTGTLDLAAGPHADLYQFSDNPGNHPANNWQGGLIIEQDLPSPSSARTILVQLKFNDQIPNGSQAGDVTLYGAANSGSFITGSTVTLDLNGFSDTINGLNGQSAANVLANVVLTSSSATANGSLTMGDNNASGTFGGIVTDNSAAHNLSLVKIGSGTETFTGPLSHHGGTTINQGTMALSGNATIASSSPITVAAGATFDASGIGGLTVGAAQTLNCVGTVVGNTTVNGTIQALDPIGTLTNNGNMTLAGGGAYIWDINSGGGSVGGDPGSSLIDVINGAVNITANSGSPFKIKIVSLTSGDVPGSAAFNPNADQQWTILSSPNAISGFNASDFTIDTSGFANDPNTVKFSIGLSGDNTSLVLHYTSTPAITTGLVSLTNNAGSTAVYTVVAGGASLPGLTYQWFQGSNPTPLSDGSDLSGSGATITINSSGTTSSLTIAGVQDQDVGGYSVTVTNSAGQSGISIATLTVVDAPSNVNVSQSATATPVATGAANVLSATASGTAPLTYQWYLGANAISGATSSTFTVDVSPNTLGNYTVVVGNTAGNATSSLIPVTGPVSVVPNQIIFEPFNYQQQAHPSSPWTALGFTNVFNQATGAGLVWQQVGNNDFTTLPSYGVADGFTVAPYGVGTRPILNDEYPVSGLAGNDPNTIYADSDVNGGQENLPFGPGGTITNGELYFSFVLQLWGMNQNPANFYDYLCGLDSGATNSTTHSMGIYIQENTAAVYPNVPYTLGVFKGNLTTSQLNPGVNGAWSPNTFLDYNVLFVVCRLNYNNSPATCDLWINPPASSFYANEVSLPTPDVANAAGAAPDVAGGVSSFFMKITQYPVDRYFTDLRVGRTWASVTPPSGPTLSLANQILTNPAGSTVVFASQNVGNLVSGNYQWTFNNGSGPVTLSDASLPDGAQVSGSLTGTLTITGAMAAEVGTYTVTGSNTDPSPGGAGATLAGGVSALLTTNLPALSISSSPPNVVLSWPTNWAVALEVATSLSHPVWTPVAAGASSFLYWPPGSGTLVSAPVSVTTSGPNYTATVPGSTTNLFFQLVPSP